MARRQNCAITNALLLFATVAVQEAVASFARTPSTHLRQASFLQTSTARGTEQDEAGEPKNSGPYRMVLHNHEDVQFVGEIKIGSQKLLGVIDTGSFELLVFSKQCALCGNKKLLYDHSKSVNFIRGDLDTMHSFGSGDTWSHEASDLVQIGPLRAENQSFWEVVDTAMPVLRTATFQAIIGLGPAESAKKLAKKREADAINAKQVMLREGKKVTKEVRKDYRNSKAAYEHAMHKMDLASNLNMHVFSICIGPAQGEPGYFIWNDTHPLNYPARHPASFMHIESVGAMHWSVELQDVRIGHADYGSGQALDLGCGQDTGSCGAVLDSGTSLIAAPKEVIAQVARSLDKLNGDCSRLDDLPDLHFRIGGNDFSLPPESYVGQVIGSIPAALREILAFSSHEMYSLRKERQVERSELNASTGLADADDENSVCQPLLMSVDAKTQFGPMWILGLPFFRHYYTTFETRPPVEPEHKPQRSIWAAPADDKCKPSCGTSLLRAPRRKRKPMRVDPAQLRVPSWVADAAFQKQVII